MDSNLQAQDFKTSRSYAKAFLHDTLNEIANEFFKLAESGFDPACRPDNFAQLEELAFSISYKMSKHLPTFGALRFGAQGPHHKEGTVLIHSVLVGFNTLRIASEVLGKDQLIQNGQPTSLARVLLLAGLLHDIAKPWPEVQERADKFLYHAEAGAEWIENSRQSFQLSNEEMELLTFLVRWHMCPHILNPDLRERFDFVRQYPEEIPEQVAKSSNLWKLLLLILNEGDALSTYVKEDKNAGTFTPAPFDRRKMYEIFGVSL